MKNHRKRRNFLKGIIIVSAIGVVSLFLVEFILFSLQVKGSGWYTFERHRQLATQSNLRRLANALVKYRAQTGAFPDRPTLEENIRVLLQARLTTETSSDTIRCLSFLDEWGQHLGFQRTETTFIIWSTGFLGGDAGSEPEWLGQFDWAAISSKESAGFDPRPADSFQNDLIVIGGDFEVPQEHIHAVNGWRIFQYPGYWAVYPRDGPFNIGKVLGDWLYEFSKQHFPNYGVLCVSPNDSV